MFVLGYVADRLALVQGGSGCPLWAVALALYLPVIPVARLARRIYGYHGEEDPSPAADETSAAPFSFDVHMMGCFETMVKIGGYIMLFSILAMYLANLPFDLPLMRPALLGAVEITTGIQAIAASGPGFPAAVLIAAATAFGGFSGIFQTKSVLKNAGLSIRHYILWKTLHSLITCMLLIGLQSLLLICG